MIQKIRHEYRRVLHIMKFDESTCEEELSVWLYDITLRSLEALDL